MKKTQICQIVNSQANQHNLDGSILPIFLFLIIFASTIVLVLSFSGDAYADYTISMTSSGAQILDVSAIGDGTSIGTDSITVTTNCRAGYNFTLATSVSDNNLYLNGDITNNASGTYFSPVDGTTALSNNRNKWGYYYNPSTPAVAPSSNSVFTAVPIISSPTTIISPSSSVTDINDSFNIYYGVAVSDNLIPGTYKMIPDINTDNGSGGYNDGTIVYYLTVAENCLPYIVTFNPTSTAGGTTLSGTGTMPFQTIPTGSTTVLNANTFSAPSGYEFDGWNTAQDGTGTPYTDEQSVTDLTTGGSSITLYAQWKKRLTFQIATMADCGKTMIDDRGVSAYRNVVYTTAKIGELCWMTRNLDLPGGTTLTSSDSNVTSNYILPTSSTSGFYDNTKTYAYNSDSTNFNDTSCGSNNPCYSYYSYTTATAGTNPSTGAATSDICPKGWRLPTQAELTTLRNSYSAGATLTASPFLGVYAGNYYNSVFQNGGSYGYYWASTAYSTSSAYFLSFYSSSAGVNYDNKYYGRSIRCVKAPSLYELVEEQNKGTQTVADLQADIVVPTSVAPISSNSGVYEYDSSSFGTSSDSSNDSKIYYYRGILDSYGNTGSYGSNGKADAYPNYVKLGNTCWRIIRTTGSGGVKLLYNGNYGTTTSGSCANSGAATGVSKSSFNTSTASNGYTSLNHKNLQSVGYTYSSAQIDSTSSATVSKLFGSSSSNENYNNNDSVIKQYIEKSWWGTSGISAYVGKLEGNAGYCVDRTIYDNDSNLLSESTQLTTPYTTATSGVTVYNFGARQRGNTDGGIPTLECPRGNVDTLTYNVNTYSTLKAPVALMTTDESILSGTGYNGVLAWSINSYTFTGSSYWLLSPYARNTAGNPRVSRPSLSGYGGWDVSNGSSDVRPVISLVSGTTPVSGSGTAIDPWIVNP